MKPRIVILNLFLLASLSTCSLPSDAAPSPTVRPVGEGNLPRPGAASAASDPELPREFDLPIPLFAADSAWNQTAASAAALPESDRQILVTYRVLLGQFDDLVGYDGPATTWPFPDVNLDEYSIPVFSAGTGQQDVVICADEGVLGWPHPKFGIETLGGPVTVPAPEGMVRPSGPQNTDADGHLVLYDANTFTAYDYFAATIQGEGDCWGFQGGKTGNRITEAGVVDFFDVRGAGANADTYYSARATGPPLLAGMILPEDVARGVIDHALAFAIPGLRNLSTDQYDPLPSDYFYPASTTETDYFSTNRYALAAGQRIRLKASVVDEDDEPVDASELAPITRMFLVALRKYGAYLVDNAGGVSFYAEDIHTANLQLSDGEVNALAGRSPGSSLPPGKTKWEIVIDTLNDELALIPFASGPWRDGDDPASALIDHANFEMVEPAVEPAPVTATPTATAQPTMRVTSTATLAATQASPQPSAPPPTAPPAVWRLYLPRTATRGVPR